MIGEIVGSYRITHQLGSGGMGVVYAAEHTVLNSKVAVKMLQPRHSADQEVVGRFFNEARAATRIKHPGIVAVFDFGRHSSGSAYLVMELLEGETLAQRLKTMGRMPWRETLVLARQIAGALGAAHAAGIVHRDLKPHNLFLVHDPDLPGRERVKVLDFGIAKLAVDKAGDDSSHTREGALLGTPKYMAPEQCRGAGRVDARADVYSLGCVLFAMICGEPPFSGEGNGEVMAKQIYELPPRPREQVPDVDPGIEDLILRCLQKDPGARPATMRAISEAIDDLLRDGERDPVVTARPQVSAVTRTVPQTLTATSTPSPVSETPAPADSARWALGRQMTTTLGASAAELSRTKPPKESERRRPWRIVTAILLMTAIGSGAALWGRFGAHGSSTPPPAPAPATAAVVADAAPMLRETAPPSPPAPTPTRVTLTIRSQPAGAAVVRIADGEFIGQCPLTLRLLPSDGATEFAVRLRGYREGRVKLRTDVDGDAAVVLERERARPAASTSSRQAPTLPATPLAPDNKPVGDGTLNPFGAGEAQP